LHLFGHPFAGISNRDADPARLSPGFNRDYPLLFHGLGSIYQQVKKDLVQLLWVTEDFRYFAKLPFQCRNILKFIPGNIDGGFQAFIQVCARVFSA
jgi:hypothetical protein